MRYTVEGARPLTVALDDETYVPDAPNPLVVTWYSYPTTPDTGHQVKEAVLQVLVTEMELMKGGGHCPSAWVAVKISAETTTRRMV
jgi:hypothetical protein